MRVLCGLLLILSAAGAWAATLDEIKLDVKEKTLANGMAILVVENHLAPVMSTVVRYRVGGVDEHAGITGISHFLEHMMFKGTRLMGTSDYAAEQPLMQKLDSLAALLEQEKAKLRHPLMKGNEERAAQIRQEMAAVQAEQAKFLIKNELWETYLENGGVGLNASTGTNGTQYFVSLPSNRLETWAFMESDRMTNQVLREFYSERDVVREERRQGYETDPGGLVWEALQASAHWSSPYRWSSIGWGSDIENYRRVDMEKHCRTYYHPANAIAVVVGDVKAEEVFAVCEKYFGPIPAGPIPREVFTDNSPQGGERRIEVEFDAKPRAAIGWHIPQAGHRDVAVLDVLANLLSRGRTSRFYKALEETRLGRVWASSNFARYPSLFVCNVTPMGDNKADDVIAAALAEIDRLKVEPVASWEIEKVRRQTEADYVRDLASNRGLASRLADMQAIAGDWRHLVDYRKELLQVTPEDIRRVVATYFTKKNRTIVTLVTPENNAADQAGF